MSKPTVASLNEELQTVKYESGNVHIAQFTCWNWEQVAVELESYDRYGEMIKMEVTKDMNAGKRCYHLVIWHYALMNREDRKWKGGDHYQQLRDTAEHIAKPAPRGNKEL